MSLLTQQIRNLYCVRNDDDNDDDCEVETRSFIDITYKLLCSVAIGFVSLYNDKKTGRVILKLPYCHREHKQSYIV